MSNIKQVGPNLWTAPEDMGVTPRFMRTEHAIKHYPKGRSLLLEPLSSDKPVPIKYTKEGAENMGEIFEYSSAGGHPGYLDMRVNSVTNRDMFFYGGLFFAFIWWTFDYFVIQEFTTINVPEFLVSGVYGLCFALSILTLFRPLAKPVRFHKKNREVYVWHKKVLYRIPWQECEFSIRVAKQNEGYRGLRDGYQLSLWLNPKHAVKPTLSGQTYVELNIFHNMNHHIPLYAYWEYVRRYMNGEEPLYIEMDQRPRVPSYNVKRAKEKGYVISTLIFIIGLPIMLLIKPNKMALWTPFKAKWPEEVHEWTGERCDWN
jgi:hypothetical protein